MLVLNVNVKNAITEQLAIDKLKRRRKQINNYPRLDVDFLINM